LLKKNAKPPVAIIREEGSNGDREMAAAFYLAGFEPWDVCMQDLIDKKISLSAFKGAVFVGGFSFADVLDSAKGMGGMYQVFTFKKGVRRFLYEGRYIQSWSLQWMPANGTSWLDSMVWNCGDQTA